MSPLWFTFGGLAWWAFFEWLRGRPQYRMRGTQDLVLIGGVGLVAAIGGSIVWVVGRFF
ncbi:hypothetical protein OKA05_29175 [Luteolibacter arcticus]|uniref:Uncharacterized protein n=1 Tax=Luteolibacter arcticus TaxID=1581411 RepID=A0ABT3GSZ8_9BACT|nr:hypothetical protein [Luteolibacter arcticus]MCW1926661.1 hypothetical protein [Luteolibacter arcticus]